MQSSLSQFTVANAFSKIKLEHQGWDFAPVTLLAQLQLQTQKIQRLTGLARSLLG
jgi:hypothetical protein